MDQIDHTAVTQAQPPGATPAGGGGATGGSAIGAGEPARIGPYRVLVRLGEGGFGTVYLAEQDAPIRRRVALKVIKPGMDSREVIARFEAERQALALMDHPGIARVFDAGMTDHGLPYFAMEHVPGVPVTEYCDAQRLPTSERLALFVDVCRAVQHAHTKGVIHRDLKPANILVTVQDGRPLPKVIDFGVAKAVSSPLTERTLFTEQGRLIGTPEYMSPEQAGTTGLDVDTRTDVYSLGVVLYELLSGTLPFASETLRAGGYEALLRIIREQDPPRPSTRLSGLGASDARAEPAGAARRPATIAEVAERRRTDPRRLLSELRGDLDWITMRALEKDRTRRFQSPAELAADIERRLRNEPVIARPPSATYRMSKFARRHRVGVVAGAVLALGTLAGVGGLVVGLGRARQAEADARADRDRARDAEIEQRRLREEADRARAAAQVEADKLKAVNDFLVYEMLGSAAPEEALGRVVTVDEVVARASERVGESFKDQPAVESAVRNMIAMVYHYQGRRADAEAHWRRALELSEASLGADHQDTLNLCANLAMLLDSEGRFEEAEVYHRRAVEGSARTLGPDDENVLTTRANHALSLLRRGLPEQAAEAASQVLEDQKRVLGADHRNVLLTANTLAAAWLELGRRDDAEALFRSVLDSRRRSLGSDHPETIASVANLAAMLIQWGRLDEADPLMAEAVERAGRVLGADHPNTLTWLSNLALLKQRQGQLEEAERLARLSLERRLATVGERHLETTYAKAMLAGVLDGAGRREEAEALYRQVLDERRELLPPDHLDTASTMSALGAILTETGRAAEAEPLLREAMRIRDAALPDGHLSRLTIRSELGACVGMLGRHEEAEPLLVGAAEAVLAAEQVRPATKERVVRRVVDYYERAGRPADAEAWRARMPPKP